MLIVALVLAVIGLAALVTAVVTSNELIAWVCIAASVIGVVLLIVDAVRERSDGRGSDEPDDDHVSEDAVDTSVRTADAEDYPELPAEEHSVGDDQPDATPRGPADDGPTGSPGTADATKPK